MELHLKYTNIEPAEDIKAYIQKRILPLEKLSLGVAEIHAWVEVGKTTRHHQEGKIWYAECQLQLPGKKSFRATATREGLFAAIDEVREELERILRNSKEKHRSKIRK